MATFFRSPDVPGFWPSYGVVAVSVVVNAPNCVVGGEDDEEEDEEDEEDVVVVVVTVVDGA